jgi:hypothetical protein
MHNNIRTRRWLAAVSCAALVLGATVPTVAAEPLPTAQVASIGAEWSTFVRQQPILSRLVISHQTAAVANLFGISVDQLRSEARGRTLADVAADHGRASADVSQVMLDAAHADLRTAMLFGVLTPEMASDLSAQMAEIVPTLVDTPVPAELLGV